MPVVLQREKVLTWREAKVKQYDITPAHHAGIDSVLFFPPEHESFHTFAELQADKPTHTIRAWQEQVSALE